MSNPCQYCEMEMNEDDQDICCDGQHIIFLTAENALLTKKLAGLEDIDEDKANLRDIAQRAIYFLDANNIYHDDLQAELDEAMK